MNPIGDYMWILLNSNVRLDATDEYPGQLWVPLTGLLVGGKHINGVFRRCLMAPPTYASVRLFRCHEWKQQKPRMN